MNEKQVEIIARKVVAESLKQIAATAEQCTHVEAAFRTEAARLTAPPATEQEKPEFEEGDLVISLGGSLGFATARSSSVKGLWWIMLLNGQSVGPLEENQISLASDDAIVDRMTRGIGVEVARALLPALRVVGKAERKG